MSMPCIGVYPGTFDPMTMGHMDIIARAARLLDKLVIGVAENPGKVPLFDAVERVAMIDAELGDLRAAGREVSVCAFDNLLIHFTQDLGANIIVRGLRAVSDFEYEFQMASMNTRLDPNIETLFLTASERQQFISAGLVKEVARLGGDITSFVSPAVAVKLVERFSKKGGAGSRK